MLEKKSIKNNSEELRYWNQKYSVPNAFGEGPTKLALMAYEIIKKTKVKSILDLGSGQGRDSLFFAEQKYSVTSVDFSPEAIHFVSESAKHRDLLNIKTIVHDLRKDLIFNKKFDLLYSNLALQFFNANELKEIFKKIHHRKFLKKFTIVLLMKVSLFSQPKKQVINIMELVLKFQKKRINFLVLQDIFLIKMKSKEC